MANHNAQAKEAHWIKRPDTMGRKLLKNERAGECWYEIQLLAKKKSPMMEKYIENC